MPRRRRRTPGLCRTRSVPHSTALATDFPRLWQNPATSMKEKKRLLRLLLVDVTLTKGDVLHADLRFTGGATRSLDIPLPQSCIQLRTTDADVVSEIDRLLDTYTDAEIADVLNERGVRTVVPRRGRACASAACATPTGSRIGARACWPTGCSRQVTWRRAMVSV